MLKRGVIVFVCLVVASGGSRATESPIDSEFARERERLAALVGPTSEQSCDGTELIVYLEGQQVRHLYWSIAMSTQLVRRQYFFSGSSPALIIEKIQAKLGPDAEPLVTPQFMSVRHYPIGSASDRGREKEFRDHAAFLLRDFGEHRSGFTPITTKTYN